MDASLVSALPQSFRMESYIAQLRSISLVNLGLFKDLPWDEWPLDNFQSNTRPDLRDVPGHNGGETLVCVA